MVFLVEMVRGAGLLRRCSCLRSRAEVAWPKYDWSIVLIEEGTSSLGPPRTRRMSATMPGERVKAENIHHAINNPTLWYLAACFYGMLEDILLCILFLA
jgi:hypothetical protein